MRKILHLSLALGALTAFAAGCGGGGSSSTALPPSSGSPTGPGSPAQAQRVTFAINIPNAAASSASGRKPGYVSSGTQSIGVVVANDGATPGPAQYVNVSTCPQVGGVTQCSVSVEALPGNDGFIISAYSAPNGGGSVLSSGVFSSIVVAGVANVTNVITLTGAVASITLLPGIATLPLGQTTTLNVVAKDASGATIVGPFSSAITLSAPNMALSPSIVGNSTDASKVKAGWNLGVSTDTPTTVTATSGSVTGTVVMTPGTGFAYYQTGTNSTTDNGSVKMTAGPDGKLYYTSIGVLSCNSNGLCTGQVGAIHQFDPATSTDNEVALQSSGIGLKFTSDGALWIGGGTTVNNVNYIYRMAPGAFSSAALTPIPIPTPTGRAGPRPNMRTFAQDGANKVWFVDAGGHRYMSFPLGGPYNTASMTSHQLPNGPAGTPGFFGTGRTINYVGGVLVVGDSSNGLVDVINPSTGLVTGQYLSNLQKSFGANGSYDSADPYDATDDGTSDYVTFIGNWNAPGTPLGYGDIEAFNPSTLAFTTMQTVNGPALGEPTVPSINGSTLYYADYALNALAYTNVSNGTARLFPQVAPGSTYFYGAGAVAAMSDGTAWFPCYGSAATFQPLCVGHTVYFAKWSIWPSSTIAVYGAGLPASQVIGIMEAPSANSGPFTVTSSNTSICTIAGPPSATDHNFAIVGQAAGACTVTVKDKNNVSQSISVTVTTTSGTVQAHSMGGK